MKANKCEEKVLPDDVSPVKYMMNEAFSLHAKFLKSFEEARLTKDAVVE